MGKDLSFGELKNRLEKCRQCPALVVMASNCDGYRLGMNKLLEVGGNTVSEIMVQNEWVFCNFPSLWKWPFITRTKQMLSFLLGNTFQLFCGNK